MDNNSKNSDALATRIKLHMRTCKTRYFIFIGIFIAGILSFMISSKVTNNSILTSGTNVNNKDNSANSNEAAKSNESLVKSTQETQTANTTVDTSKSGTITAEESKKSTYVPKFKKMESSKDPNKDMATKVKLSPNGKLKAQLDGRGINAAEEGVADIFIVDDKNKKWRLQLIDNDIKFTPMYLEWLDDKNILITMGYSQGHSSYGGSVYTVNIDSGIATLKYEVDINKEQVKSITRLDNEIKLKVIVFTDDIQNNYKEEERTIKK